MTIRGYRSDKRIKKVKAEYILFDDKKTILSLEEQDYHTYHDFNYMAREIEVFKDKERWKQIYNDKVNYPESNVGV